VDGIVKMLEDSFAVSLQGSQRDNYINDHARVTNMRQFSHWVSKIVLDDEEMGDDAETIENLTALFSSQKSISDKFFTEIGKYIDDSTVSVIGIPKYNCPACNYEQIGENSNHPLIIPLDVARVFFTLLDQRINKALTNALV